MLIVGIDEAGRGPLAGPVFAAAVILDPARRIEGLKDSKLLPPPARERLANEVKQNAIAWAVASSDVAEIDTLNILKATLLAMRRAFDALGVTGVVGPFRAGVSAIFEVVVDGDRVPDLGGCRTRSIVKGDRRVPVISAASILAKTARDALLVELDRAYPLYGFAEHKGYATAEHLAALNRHGPCPIHRRTFAPVLQPSLDFGDGWDD